MASISSIVDKVQRRVIDLPPAVSEEVRDLVVKSHKDVQMDYNFNIMEAVAGTMITTPGVRLLGTLPVDFKEVRGDAKILLSTGDHTFLHWLLNREEGFESYSDRTDDKGAPRHLSFYNTANSGTKSVEVWPLPDVSSDWLDKNYRISIPYYKFLPDLSIQDDNYSDWLISNGEWYLAFMATGHAFMNNWDEQRAAVWFQLAQTEFKKVWSLNTSIALPKSNVLTPRADVYGKILQGRRT